MATDVAHAQLLTGGEAVAEAMRQIDPDVVPVYPITPQTPIIQTFASFVADGRAHGELVDVESEHSAMSAAVAAALAGARTMTATSSQGLALMAEIVYIAASLRAPVVMALGNRALSGPINIHCDHSDSMLIRDSGVIQLFAENAQEAYDLTVMAPRLAEHPDVLLPVLVCLDGFTITHSAEPVVAAGGRGGPRVRRRVPDPARPARPRPCHQPGAVRDARLLLRAAPPAGGRDRPGTRRLHGPVRRVRAALGQALRSRSRRTGSKMPSRALVCLGSTAGTAKDVVDELRDAGVRAGLLKICSFRPLPAEAIFESLRRADAVAVLDRADSPGGIAPLFAEVATLLAGEQPGVRSHVYGLGGRELHPADIRAVFDRTAPHYLGVREARCPA